MKTLKFIFKKTFIYYACITYCSLIFMLITLISCAKSKPFKNNDKSINVVFKNQIETINILQNLWVENENGWPYANFTNPVKEDISLFFKKYSKHKAVKMTQEIANSELSFSGPLAIATRLSSFPNAKITNSFEDIYSQLPLKENVSAKAYLDDYVKQVNLFYIESNVAGFLKKHSKSYTCSKTEILSLIPDKKVLINMENYYGKEFSNYYFIPSLTLFPMAFGTKIKNNMNSFDLYQIVGAQEDFDNVNNKCGFSNKDNLYILSLHEYGHSFVDITTQMANRTKHLQNAVAKEMEEISYADWDVALDEHIVRSIEIRILNTIVGMETNTKNLREKYINNGFKYIPFIEKHLSENYENNRKEYKTFKQYLPKLISSLAEYKK